MYRVCTHLLYCTSIIYALHGALAECPAKTKEVSMYHWDGSARKKQHTNPLMEGKVVGGEREMIPLFFLLDHTFTKLLSLFVLKLNSSLLGGAFAHTIYMLQLGEEGERERKKERERERKRE